MLCFTGRILIRLSTRRRLFLDDNLLIVSAIALTGSVGILFHDTFIWFLMNASFVSPSLLLTETYASYTTLRYTAPRLRRAWTVLVWTCIFLVKFCFFAFFKPLVWHLRGLTIWLWTCVAFTICAYATCLVEGYFLDNFYSDRLALPAKPFGDRSWFGPCLAFTVAIAIVDVLSDLMSESISIMRRLHAPETNVSSHIDSISPFTTLQPETIYQARYRVLLIAIHLHDCLQRHSCGRLQIHQTSYTGNNLAYAMAAN